MILVFTLAAVSVGASGCGGEQATQTTEPSVAEKLATIDGNASATAFESTVSCLTASGAAGTETEIKVADTLVASWEQSSKADSLWEFSRALASLYGC
jgi:hypothetical protein